MSDPLPSDIEDALSARSESLGAFADHFHYFSVVPSTNDVALRLAEDGAQDGTIVFGQPLGQAELVFPGEAPSGVAGERDVVWRVGVDEVPRLEFQILKITNAKVPLGQRCLIVAEITCVVDVFIASERHIIEALLIKAA